MIDLIPDSAALEVIIILFLGLVLGSFSTAIVYRTRHNESWIWNRAHEDKARSFCPSCKHALGVKDLIPVFSWWFQKGRCRYCAAKIPFEYVQLELLSIFFCFAVYVVAGFTAQGLFFMFLLPFFVSQGVLLVKYKMLSKLLLSIIVAGGLLLPFL